MTPGIMFTYRLNIIWTHRAGIETELFARKSEFLTGSVSKEEELLILTKATKNEIDEDLEEIKYENAEIREGEIYSYPLPNNK